MQNFWRQVQAEFPNAELQASTLDNFADELWQVKNQILPLVSQGSSAKEIRNAWLPQMATDPRRLSALRAVSRLRSEWLGSGRLAWDDHDLNDYSSRLLLPVEHSFGTQTQKVLNGAWHALYWTNGLKCGAAKRSL